MDTKEEILKQLEEAKSNIEASATQKAKDAFAGEVKSLEAKLKTLEDQLKNVDTTKIADGVTTATKAIEDVQKTVKEINDARVISEERAKKSEDAIDKLLSDVKGISRNGSPETGIKTINDAIVEALNEGDNYDNLKMLALNHKDRKKRFTIELKGFSTKVVGDMTTGNVTGGSRYGQIMAPGIIENPKRKVHVRQLVPIGSAGPGNTFTFMAENGTGEGAIAPTAETGTKPQFDLDLIEKTVNFEIIAGWLRVTRKAMNNIPGFLSYLNSRLPELLLRAEDTQLLTGDGVSPNISGIMDSGNFTAANTSSDILIEQLIDGIAQLEDEEERYATGILIRPVEYYGFFKNKAEDSGLYDLPKNVTFVNGVLYISGIPVFASTAMTADKYIVGDWQMGAQLLIQEGMRIEFFEQDGTNVRENKITVRIEESVAFPIYGNNYFIVGDIGAS